MNKTKTKDDIIKYVQGVAIKRGWKLNPDTSTLDMLVEGLRDYYNKVGYFNCPCRDSQEDMKLDRDIMCPCDFAPLDIEEFGYCYCSLFFDPNFDFSKPIEMIPERRVLE